MIIRKTHDWTLIKAAAIVIIALVQACALAQRPGWQRDEVSWRLSDGEKIKAISHPQAKTVPIASQKQRHKTQRKLISADSSKQAAIQTRTSSAVYASVIDSPSINGFVPWIAVTATDARADLFADDPISAVTEYLVTGNYLTSTPESDYVIGIFDTGASAHVLGNNAASRLGIFNADLVTTNTITVSGVTGETDVLISQPLGIFINGLGAIDSQGLLNTSNLMGQSNVAVAVGMGEAPVDLPTAIGTPLSVYYTAVFHNNTQITVNRDGNDYTGPDIKIYQQDDPAIPAYANKIPLELRPLGGQSVQFIYDIDENFDITPTSPSVIIGNSSQSVFFVASVDLYDALHSAIDKTRFMLDTGAQISVIGSRVASRLGVNPANPEFEVEIQGVTGTTTMAPGFYLDSIDIPALGEWLSFTNVPVVLLDIASPEGGTIDGIIGMNLFANLNFVFRSGGLFLQDDPSIEYEAIQTFAGDIAPPGGDGVVNWLDLEALAQAWLTTPQIPNWYTPADLVVDGIIDFKDLSIIANNWLQNGSGPLPQ